MEAFQDASYLIFAIGNVILFALSIALSIFAIVSFVRVKRYVSVTYPLSVLSLVLEDIGKTLILAEIKKDDVLQTEEQYRFFPICLGPLIMRGL